MAKFKDIEILTKQVYLNIEKNEEVETKGMTTKDAIANYGELEVLEVGEPQYTHGSIRMAHTRSTLPMMLDILLRFKSLPPGYWNISLSSLIYLSVGATIIRVSPSSMVLSPPG